MRCGRACRRARSAQRTAKGPARPAPTEPICYRRLISKHRRPRLPKLVRTRDRRPEASDVSPLGDDPTRWAEELAAAVRKSSPEVHNAAGDGLDEALHAIARRGRIAWSNLQGRRDAPQRAAIKSEIEARAHDMANKLALEAVAEEEQVSPLGDDPASWREELIAYLERAAPEGYAHAVANNRIESHLDSLLRWADNAKGAGTDLEALKQGILERAVDLAEGPEEHISVLNAEGKLTYEVLTDLIEAQAATAPARRDNLTHRLVEAMYRNPDAGSLLEHSIFSSLADEELYQQARGGVAYGLGDIEAAAAIFQRLWQVRPSVYNALCLAGCYRNLGRDTEMIEVLQSARAGFPDDRRVHIGLAHALFIVGETAAANEAFAVVREGYARDSAAAVSSWADRADELARAIAESKVYPDSQDDVYDDSFAISTWWNYWYHFNVYGKHQHAEGILGEVVPERVGSFISGRDVNSVVDFGVMCGEPLARLARGHRDMRFVGIDRQPSVMELNRRAYPLDNIEFVAGDIFDFLLSRPPPAPALLYHVRTAPFLYPDFLRKLYRTCHDSGIEYIAILESYSLSLTSFTYVDFEHMEPDAEIRGGGLFHHNYPRLLSESGYEVVRREHVRNPLLVAGVDSSIFLVGQRT